MSENTTIDCHEYFTSAHNKYSLLSSKTLDSIYSVLFTCLISSISLAPLTNAAIAQEPAPTALSETFSDWQINCQTFTDSGKKMQRYCQMSQQQVDEKSGSMVLLFTIDAVNPETNKTAVNILVPFGVNLATGITVIVNGSELLNGQYKTCLPQGCIASLQLEKKQVANLLASNEAKIKIDILNNDKSISVPLGLKGFQQAKTRLDKLSSS